MAEVFTVNLVNVSGKDELQDGAVSVTKNEILSDCFCYEDHLSLNCDDFVSLLIPSYSPVTALLPVYMYSVVNIQLLPVSPLGKSGQTSWSFFVLIKAIVLWQQNINV